MQTRRRYREAEMSPAVTAWLRGMGYSVYAEVPSIGVTDHVGVRWSDQSIICVEMKCSFTHKLMSQAIVKQLMTPLVYVALPQMPRKKSLQIAADYGLGVWVAGSVVLEPNYRRVHADNHWRKNLLEFCQRSPEGGIGGMPTVAGDGPAIRVTAAVDAYLEAHPGASWKEIFANVPNHYAHARSMAGALPFARSRASRTQHNRDLLAISNPGS